MSRSSRLRSARAPSSQRTISPAAHGLGDSESTSAMPATAIALRMTPESTSVSALAVMPASRNSAAMPTMRSDDTTRRQDPRMQVGDAEEDAQHRAERRHRGNAERAGIGERIAQVALQRCPGEAQRRADRDTEQRPRQSQLEQDRATDRILVEPHVPAEHDAPDGDRRDRQQHYKCKQRRHDPASRRHREACARGVA